MANIIDNTKSKRVIRRDDASDVPRWQQMSERLEAEVEEIELALQAREDSREYQQIVGASRKRMDDIAIRAMAVDLAEPGAMLKLAEIRGQFNERLILTMELGNIRKKLEEKTSLLKTINEKIRSWIQASMMKGK